MGWLESMVGSTCDLMGQGLCSECCSMWSIPHSGTSEPQLRNPAWLHLLKGISRIFSGSGAVCNFMYLPIFSWLSGKSEVIGNNLFKGAFYRNLQDQHFSIWVWTKDILIFWVFRNLIHLFHTIIQLVNQYLLNSFRNGQNSFLGKIYRELAFLHEVVYHLKIPKTDKHEKDDSIVSFKAIIIYVRSLKYN